MTTRAHPRNPHHRQRGTSLLEALVGFLLVAVGLLGSAQLQLRLRQSVDHARQQADAVQHAQRELENLRAFVSHEMRPGVSSYAAITSQSRTIDSAPGSPTAYRIGHQVRDSSTPVLKDLEISVAWTDRHRSDHRRSLFTILGGQSPALILPLGSRPPAARVLARHPAIPRDAHDMGDQRSIFKPVTDGSEAWLFDNRSGRIIVLCSGVPTHRASRQLSSGDLSDCVPTNDLLLAGRIRHSLAPFPSLPDPAAAGDVPLPMAIELSLTSSGHPRPPRCMGEPVRLVDVGVPGAPRVIAVAIAATPASQGLASWIELGDRYWRYHCMVAPAASPAGTPAAAPHWIGRPLVTPHGWTIAATPGARRICRYSADTDNNGAVDRAAEAPSHALPVIDALVEQNFLVIDGSQACPSKPASHGAAGSLPWSHANPATVPHQG